ncbi:MAG: response regulator [Magnetococcales bacterium]|nr:response regulator [Magnetococcales bacterium]
MTELLVVDDEVENRVLLQGILQDGGYKVALAEDGDEALALLEENPNRFTSVLLDRMMPRMNGMDVLKRMKNHPQLKEIPVILQTAMARPEEISEGLGAGAYYYITKPYPDDEVFLAVVTAAVKDRLRFHTLQYELDKVLDTMALTYSWELHFRTLDEAQAVSAMLAKVCPNPTETVFGLAELLVNAVEHGNAGITYDEKGPLNQAGTFDQEVERRLTLPENAAKNVKVFFSRSPEAVQIIIKDDGAGFNWEEYLVFQPERALDNHGRGIAMAKLMQSSQIEYQGNGNEVRVTLSSRVKD